MPNTVLYDRDGHKNVLLEDYGHGLSVQANQHVVVHGDQGMILDPGGHKVYNKALSETTSLLRGAKLSHILFSHQDPDIVAAANGWLMTTDADAYCPDVWLRFIPHFGVDSLVVDRLHGVGDEGTVLDLGGCEILVLPAHFLHSCGNLQAYDPVSKILYSGDLGSSLGMDYVVVPDFDAHVRYMEGFHRRYMTSKTVLRWWAEMISELDVETIAPQHGAIFQGRAMVKRFVDWLCELDCGLDVMRGVFRIPKRR